MQKFIFVFLCLAIIFRVLTIQNNYLDGKTVRIDSRVLAEPIVYNNQRLVNLAGLTMYVELFPEINYGDKVIVEGVIKGQRLVNPKIVAVTPGESFFGMREQILDVFQKALPEPHASLVSGIVIGSKSSLPQDFWERLKKTGTAHVVVASGMNVTFAISLVLNILVNFISRRRALVIAVTCAWVYVLMSGLDAPLIRAAVMGTVAFGAQSLGRTTSALRALFVSAAIMLILKPIWIYELGFILSFMATLSLIIFEPKISSLLSKVPFVLKKNLATSLAAQIGVAPVLFISFGSFNIMSPFINALILWSVPPIMIIGALGAFFGLFIPRLGELITVLAFPFTFWFIKIVELTS